MFIKLFYKTFCVKNSRYFLIILWREFRLKFRICWTSGINWNAKTEIDLLFYEWNEHFGGVVFRSCSLTYSELVHFINVIYGVESFCSVAFRFKFLNIYGKTEGIYDVTHRIEIWCGNIGFNAVDKTFLIE